MHEAMFGSPKGARSKLCEFGSTPVVKLGEKRKCIENQKAAMIFEPIAGNSLRHPGGKLDFRQRSD
jgi:hypothetical protein